MRKLRAIALIAAAALLSAAAPALAGPPSSSQEKAPEVVAATHEETVTLRRVTSIAGSGGEIRLEGSALQGTQLYVFVERVGRIYRLADSDPPELFFDVAATIEQATDRSLNTSGGHSGMRGLAFHPDFTENGRFYTSVMESRPVDPAGHHYLSDVASPITTDSVLIEWTYDFATRAVDPGSYREVFRVGIPVYDHPIKQISFNPFSAVGDEDYGLLYVAHGDGSVQSASSGGGQGNDARGKILRVDPLATGELPYRVPATNPFVGVSSMLDEVFSLGHRNPHTLSFGRDRAGEPYLIAGEAGRDNAEEINLITAGSDYGWSQREGTFVHLNDQVGVGTGVAPLPDNEAEFGFTYPAVQMLHNGAIGESVTGEAIAGGFLVDNGSTLSGRYFYSEFVRGRLFYSNFDEMTAAVTELSVGTPGRSLPSDLTQAEIHEPHILFDHDDDPSSPPLERDDLLDVLDDEASYDGSGRADIRFGQGAAGELYIFSKRNGWIYVVEESIPPSAEQGSSDSCPVAFAYTRQGTGILLIDGHGRLHAAETQPDLVNSSVALGDDETVVSLAPTHTGLGAQVVTSIGRSISTGDASALGDVSHLSLNAPIVASRSAGISGYYMLAGDGGVFSIGGSAFHGSTGGLRLNSPVTSMMLTSEGYRLAAGDGGVFAFNASFRGSMGGIPLNEAVVGIDGTDDGYWLAARDGGIFSFGLPFFGSLGATDVESPVIDFAAMRDGSGYSMLVADGRLFHFGLAQRWFGSVSQPVVCG